MLGEHTNVHDVLHQPEGVQQPGACILTTTMATIGRAKRRYAYTNLPLHLPIAANRNNGMITRCTLVKAHNLRSAMVLSWVPASFLSPPSREWTHPTRCMLEWH